jgi:hypothetical protein
VVVGSTAAVAAGYRPVQRSASVEFVARQMDFRDVPKLVFHSKNIHIFQIEIPIQKLTLLLSVAVIDG